VWGDTCVEYAGVDEVDCFGKEYGGKSTLAQVLNMYCLMGSK